MIKARIPKALSPFNCYVKANFEKKNNDFINAGLLSQSHKIAAVLKKVVEDFKALPPSEVKKYAEQASVTQEARQKALSKLTEKEREVLLIDKRKRLLRKKIFLVRKLQALRRKFSYPESSLSSFLLFLQDRKHLLADSKRVSERSKAAGLLWKSSNEAEKSRYASLANQLNIEARKQKAEWRSRMTKMNLASLEKMDGLKSELRKLKLHLTKINRSTSIEDAIRASKLARASPKQKKVVKKDKSKRVVKKKAAPKKKAKKVGLKVKSVRATTKKTTSRKVTDVLKKKRAAKK